MLLLRPARRTTSFASAVLLAALPSGGQLTARRNAWAAMSSDAARARARREAELALREAETRYALPLAR